MAVEKLSQIALAPAPPATTDFVVGVTAGAIDYRYSLGQIASTVATPAGPTGAVQYNNGGAFGGNANFLTDGIGNISLTGNSEVTSGLSLLLGQTGDTFGETSLTLLNRFGANGAEFNQSGTVSVVDFIFNINGTGGLNGQNNIRYERRSAFWMGASQADHEFQIGIDGSVLPDATFFTGNYSSGVVLQPAGGSNPFNLTFALDTASDASHTTVTVADLAFRVNGSGANTGTIFGRSLRFSAWTPTLVTAADSKFEWQFADRGDYTGNSGTTYFSVGDTVVWFGEKPQFSVNTTGGGSALLGANCPATTLTAPYTWIEALSSDGSLVYVPAWK